MRPDPSLDIAIVRAIAIKPDADGILDDALLVKEKRSRKVGTLPGKARMVLAAARHCLPPEVAAASAPIGDVGISLGTLYGSMDVAEQCLHTVYHDGFNHVVPSWYATGLPNATTAIVASLHNLGGPNLTFLGHQAGVDALINGCRQIIAGRVSAMLAGGFDMPSHFFGTQLTTSTRAGSSFSVSVNVHPGVGLFWLSDPASADIELARIVGWSQQFYAGDRLSSVQITSMVDAALARQKRHARPTIHMLYPGQENKVDYLAASAPIYLANHVLQHEQPGLHAVIAKGIGASVACLLIQKH